MTPQLAAASTKAYLGYAQTRAWLTGVVAAADHPAVVDGALEVAVLPASPMLPLALEITRRTPVTVGAQDVSRYPAGAYTGEVSADLLAELGVRYVEVGHAERVRCLAEGPPVLRDKIAQAARVGLVPLICVGEDERTDPRQAAAVCLAQLRAMVGDTTTKVVLAYEPVWAIGAARPASPDYVVEVAEHLREHLARGTRLLYGGSAGPGLFARLEGALDGLFLGRFVHDPRRLRDVLDEIAGTRVPR